VPRDFDIIYFVHVADRHQAEQYVHTQLATYRASPGKEFFSAPLVQAIEALDRAAESLPITIDRGRPRLRPSAVFRGRDDHMFAVRH